MNNNNKSNKNHFDVSDFTHTRPLSTHDNETKINLNNKEDQELIMGKQEQELEASKEHRRPATTQNQRHQQPLTSSTDQDTLAGLPRRILSPRDDVEDIFGISTLEPSYHGSRVLLMIIESTWKSKAKVAQSSWTASQNTQQLLTTYQDILASPPRRDPNPLDDVEGRAGISAHGSSYHDPRDLLEVTKGGLKIEAKVTQLTEEPTTAA